MAAVKWLLDQQPLPAALLIHTLVVMVVMAEIKTLEVLEIL